MEPLDLEVPGSIQVTYLGCWGVEFSVFLRQELKQVLRELLPVPSVTWDFWRSGWDDDGWRIPRVWCDKSCETQSKLKIRKKCRPVNVMLWGLLPPSMEAKNWYLQLSFLSSMTVKVPFLMEIVTRICFGSIDGWCWYRYRWYIWRCWELAQNSSFMKRMMRSRCCIGPSMMCYLNVIWCVSTVVVGFGQYQAGLSSFLVVELSSERLNRTKQLAKPINNMTREAKGHRIAKRIGEKGPRMQFSNAIHLRMMHVFLSFRCHKVCERVNVVEKRGWIQWPHYRATDYPKKCPRTWISNDTVLEIVFVDFRMWTLYGKNWILGLQASGVQLGNHHQISGSTDVRIALGWRWFLPER